MFTIHDIIFGLFRESIIFIYIYTLRGGEKTHTHTHTQRVAFSWQNHQPFFFGLLLRVRTKTLSFFLVQSTSHPTYFTRPHANRTPPLRSVFIIIFLYIACFFLSFFSTHSSVLLPQDTALKHAVGQEQQPSLLRRYIEAFCGKSQPVRSLPWQASNVRPWQECMPPRVLLSKGFASWQSYKVRI